MSKKTCKLLTIAGHFGFNMPTLLDLYMFCSMINVRSSSKMDEAINSSNDRIAEWCPMESNCDEDRDIA